MLENIYQHLQNLQIGHPSWSSILSNDGSFLCFFCFKPRKNCIYGKYDVCFCKRIYNSFFVFDYYFIIGEKIVLKNNSISNSNAIIILWVLHLSDLYAFTFSDSFWFNAVEAEVYAMATMIMALLFWLGFKWEENMDKNGGGRWLVLISFVVGLSFGVHFMGLLAIPAIGMIYFFKKNPSPTLKSFVIANILSIAILLFIFKLLLPSVLGLFGYLEVFFVK